jgi:hypothetical protein
MAHMTWIIYLIRAEVRTKSNVFTCFPDFLSIIDEFLCFTPFFSLALIDCVSSENVCCSHSKFFCLHSHTCWTWNPEAQTIDWKLPKYFFFITSHKFHAEKSELSEDESWMRQLFFSCRLNAAAVVGSWQFNAQFAFLLSAINPHTTTLLFNQFRDLFLFIFSPPLPYNSYPR